MKKLVCTRSDDGIEEMCNISHPIIKQYADRVGADFLFLSHDCEVSRHYRIMKFYDLFEEYDKIYSIDSDVLITKHCPNIFEATQDDEAGSVFEDKGSRQKHRRQLILQVQEKFGDVNWSQNYINTGSAVFPKSHRDIFQKIDNQFWDGWGYDDIHLGWQIHKYDFKIRELSYKWNHMTMFSEPWNKEANRFQSYIIHYAGVGIFDRRMARNRIDQMQKDLQIINRG